MRSIKIFILLDSGRSKVFQKLIIPSILGVLLSFIISCARMTIPNDYSSYKSVGIPEFKRLIIDNDFKELDIEIRYESYNGVVLPPREKIFLKIENNRGRWVPIKFQGSFYLNEIENNMVIKELNSKLTLDILNRLSIINAPTAKYKLLVLYTGRKYLGHDQSDTGGFYCFLLLSAKVLIINKSDNTLSIFPYSSQGKSREILNIMGGIREANVSQKNIYEAAQQFYKGTIDDIHTSSVSRILSETIIQMFSAIKRGS